MTKNPLGAKIANTKIQTVIHMPTSALLTHSHTRSSAYFETPYRLAEPGDVYVATTNLITVGGKGYSTGDTFEILERTKAAPYGYSWSLGNLLIKCKYGESVWSCFEICLAEGHLKLQSEETAPVQ